MSHTESMVLGATCALALGSTVWAVARRRSSGAAALGEALWAAVAALLVMATVATAVWLGGRNGE